MKNRRMTWGTRRGAIGVAAVIVLVFCQLLIVGVVIAGTRDEDATVQRLNTSRAFYAAEGGLNMAIREVLSNSDDDGDGAVGTLSNNAILADDPGMGEARVYVVKAVSGTITTMVSRGRCGMTRRQLTTEIE